MKDGYLYKLVLPSGSTFIGTYDASRTTHITYTFLLRYTDFDWAFDVFEQEIKDNGAVLLGHPDDFPEYMI